MKNIFLSLLITSNLFLNRIPTEINSIKNDQKIVELTGNDIGQSLASQYAYVYDYSNNQVLLDKNSTSRMYPASMTKLMTALLLAEHVTDWNQTITISYEMLAGLSEANASVVGWQIGATVNLRDVLYGILLPSGADAANATAFFVSGSIEDFVNLMNQRAIELEMNDSHFMNPTGLHDENHYSSCQDIAKLLKTCISNSEIYNALQAQNYTDSTGLSYSNTWQKMLEETSISANGLLGGKTGFTFEAKYCLASFGVVNDINVISVTGYGDGDFQNIIDASTIYNWLSSDYQKTTVLKSNDVIKTITLKHIFNEENFDVLSPITFYYDKENSSTITIDCDIPDSIDFTNNEQTYDCNIKIYENDIEIKSIPIKIKINKETNLLNRIIISIKSFFNK